MKHLKDDDIMPFGKHKGKKMVDVPAPYLIWIYEESKCTPEVAFYINDNLQVLKEEIKRTSR